MCVCVNFVYMCCYKAMRYELCNGRDGWIGYHTYRDTHTHTYLCVYIYIYTYRFLYTYCTRTHPRAKRCSLKPSSLGTVWEFCCQTRPRFSAVPRTPSCKVFSYNWCKASPRWPQVWLATLCPRFCKKRQQGITRGLIRLDMAR